MKHYLSLLIVVLFPPLSAEEDLEFTNIDVASLATNTYGTELLLLENSHYTEQKSYKFEDFFWTGSGDGPDEEGPWTSEVPAVIYKTSTVITTVFVEIPATQANASTQAHKCLFNCTESSEGEISPTPTFPGSIDEDFSNASQQFWLLTVLKGDGKDPVIIDLKNSLARLYKVAFQRQQARHLGIISRQKRQSPVDKLVNVYIHEVNKQTRNGEDKIEVVYHVEMLGKPVDAHTAASDMTLVSDEEVRQELGFPFEIKAEPYVKASEPLGLAKAKNTWFVIGISIIGVLLILLILAFLLLGVGKKKRPIEGRPLAVENKKHIFERGVGVENKGLVRDDETLSESNQAEGTSPTYIHFGEQHVTSVVLRPQSSFSPTSSSSSLDISPLMSLGKKRKSTPKKKLSRPRAAINKTVPVRHLPPEVLDSDSGSSRKDESPDYGDNFDPGVMSPKSFLSMPSVKSFPRTNMPEPLNRVLEPVSVTNLDMPDGSEPSTKGYKKSDSFIRHGSVDTMGDPGIIGPVVWKMHSERLKHGMSVDQGVNDFGTRTPGNITRMRKRFHDLLDDTFSLFNSSRKTSPVNSPVDDRSRPVAIDVKSHSASDNRPTDMVPTLRPRPKTTGTKYPHSTTPSYAWSSTAPSPLIRPVSAAPKIDSTHTSAAPSRISTALGESFEIGKAPGGILKPPRVNVEHVLAEGRFRPSDPAISVIEAIKSELEKVSLPGSSTDLNK
ncbi:uncharacterized protein [Euwallacea fornicatus]|uniref:uncharacterized protein isoform X1 n=1 Tax=Euwallacea fornicatus TaxID=995702 RepID=UPI00338D6108